MPILIVAVLLIISTAIQYLFFVFLAWLLQWALNATFGLDLDINIWAAGVVLVVLSTLVEVFTKKMRNDD